MSPSIGVIGLGKMAQALVEPLLTSGAIASEQLMAVVGRAESAVALQQGAFSSCPIHPSGSASAAEVWTCLLYTSPSPRD